jgi:hypothetical protein
LAAVITPEPECICDLHEITTAAEHARGESQFIRGMPNGCPIHETPNQRELRIERERVAAEVETRRAEAMQAARIAGSSSITVGSGKPQERRPILPPNFDPKTARWAENVGTDDEPEWVQIGEPPQTERP